MHTFKKYGKYLKQNNKSWCRHNNELDLAHFVSAPGLAWQACLKKTEVKLELIADYDMFMMVEKDV